jgi:hypothetical protein
MLAQVATVKSTSRGSNIAVIEASLDLRIVKAPHEARCTLGHDGT